MRIARFAPLLLLGILSCSAKPLAPVPGGLAYDASRAELSAKGIRAAFALSLDPASGIATVSLRLENRSRHPVSLDSSSAELIGKGQYSSPLLSLDPEGAQVAPGATSEYRLGFKPINNPSLYARYQLQGDFLPDYALSPTFIKSPDGSSPLAGELRFTMAKGSYAAAIARYGIEARLVPYACSTDGPSFADRERILLERAGLSASDPDEPPRGPLFVQLAGDEVYLDQWMFKFSPYRVGQDLFVPVRMVNRMPNQVICDVSALQLRAGGKLFSPAFDIATLKSRLSRMNGDYGPSILVVGQEDRADFLLKYTGVGEAGSFDLILDGISAYKGGKLFAGPLSYRETQG